MRSWGKASGAACRVGVAAWARPMASRLASGISFFIGVIVVVMVAFMAGPGYG